ncbi:hypothetical protein C922_02306 [Plasmodium inui San Antonio 1]|uniref:Uncharacterized protein n=1 Tax=Plasmodium inui San Antonio 1 TaxID=1237626 RepID=W7AP51_9APIC|nr:hypothetical protein C922_02306 [Plasmodium inui San Antonio 1]EUD67156.1 hypothetical protein C922_02306 [Plasmodium inui San Antonio 1]
MPNGERLMPYEERLKPEGDRLMPNQDRLIANKITQLLQHYSRHSYPNGNVLQLIRSYVKHNVDSFSLIRLCGYVNYFLNLKVKGDRSFNFVITNSLIKKIKNDEFVDLYGVCLIAKFVLRERVKNGDLLSLLGSLVRSKGDATASPFDVYNLVVSLLSIQSEGLLRGDLSPTKWGTERSKQSSRQTSTHDIATHDTATHDSAYPSDGVTHMNEQNVHALLHLYLNARRVKNEELVLIINTLRSMDRTAFFYQMNLTKDQRVQLYEALLRRVNFEQRFHGKVLALFLFNLRKMVKLGEISEGVFFSTVLNLGAAFREAAAGTKLQAMWAENPTLRIPKGVEIPTGDVTNGLSGLDGPDGMDRLHGNLVGEAAQGGPPQLRTHFTLQEIGMVLQFYDALMGVSQGKRGSTGGTLQPVRHTAFSQQGGSFYDEGAGAARRMEGPTGEEGAVAAANPPVKDLSEDAPVEETPPLAELYEPSVHLLKESLLLYAQASYKKKVKMNTLDFCTLLKGLSNVFQNTFLDRNILPLFQNFLIYNGKRIKINELQMILKLILEKRKLDLFSLLCGGRSCSIFEPLQSVLLTTVLNESPNWWNQERMEACIMCFYYLSFLNFNRNTYLVVNRFVMNHVTYGRAVALVPYVVLSKFNYHLLEVRAVRRAESVIVSEAVGEAESVRGAEAVEEAESLRGAEEAAKTSNDELPPNGQITPNFDRMDTLFQLINRHFEKYRTFFVLNCLYALTKFVKDNRTIGLPPFSNFSFPELFSKLSDRLLMQSGVRRQPEGDNIRTHYDFFVNYVKYNYCLLFLCQYVDLEIFLQRVPLEVEFPFGFYTPFNAYLTAEFLANYERLLGSGRVSGGVSGRVNGAVTGTNSLPFSREVMNSPWREIQMEKKKLLKNVTKYADAHCKVMSIHDLIHLIKAFKVVAPLLGSGHLSTLHTCMSNLPFSGNVKTSTSFELLTELIKFMYHFELQNGEVFDDCHDRVVDMLILAFRIVFKNLPDRTDNNYLGMLQFSLLYVSHFVRGANLLFNSLSLTDLKRADYFTSLSPMNLDKYPQSSCTFQLQILKVLKGVVKNDKRLLNEYRVGDTPYTVDILIT